MRDYALHQASSFGEFPAGPLVRLFRHWGARRAIRRLAQLDDRMLRDIGLTRADVAWAADLPLDVHAGLALEQRVVLRRRDGARTAADRRAA